MEAVKFEPISVRSALERYERAKILEIYFARLDGRVPDIIPAELKPLYEVELGDIKAYLLGQVPQDKLLNQILKLMI